jgi:hypothetical protein
MESVGGKSETDGKGFGLDSVWMFIQATGIDQTLYNQVREIVKHLAQTDSQSYDKLAQQLKDMKQQIDTDAKNMQESISARFSKMETDQFKSERVTEALAILRKTHYSCICSKSKFPSCLQFCIDSFS